MAVVIYYAYLCSRNDLSEDAKTACLHQRVPAIRRYHYAIHGISPLVDGKRKASSLTDFNLSVCLCLGGFIALSSHVRIHNILTTFAF